MLFTASATGRKNPMQSFLTRSSLFVQLQNPGICQQARNNITFMPLSSSSTIKRVKGVVLKNLIIRQTNNASGVKMTGKLMLYCPLPSSKYPKLRDAIRAVIQFEHQLPAANRNYVPREVTLIWKDLHKISWGYGIVAQERSFPTRQSFIWKYYAERNYVKCKPYAHSSF